MLLPFSLISASLKQLSRDITNNIIVRQKIFDVTSWKRYCVYQFYTPELISSCSILYIYIYQRSLELFSYKRRIQIWESKLNRKDLLFSFMVKGMISHFQQVERHILLVTFFKKYFMLHLERRYFTQLITPVNVKLRKNLLIA